MNRTTLTPSPFLSDPARPHVQVVRGDDPYNAARQCLQVFDLSPARGKRVLVKPNAGRLASAGSGVTTDPRVVAAVVDAFLGVDASVSVGESPISGVSTLDAFEETGIGPVVRERGVPLIDMDARPAVQVPIPDGEAIHSLRVCPEVLEHDIVVSVPVMKMHMHTGVTLAVKNMKGCLWRRSKVTLHMLPPVEGRDEKPINIAIADMARVLRPHLSVIDGTVGMEGLGPSAGAPKPVGVVLAGADAFAADAVACALMGVRAENVPHLAIGAENHLGVIDLGEIDVSPEEWADWTVPFAAPPSDLAIEFPDVTVMDKNSCSACQSTLLLFLKRYGDQIFDYFPPDSEVRFAIGKGHDTVPEGTVCIGNCTAKHRGQGVFVPGCPPVASEILSAVSGTPSIDSQDGGTYIPPDCPHRGKGAGDEESGSCS